MRAVVAIAIGVLGGTPPLEACSTFCFDDGHGPIVCKNYDWHFSDGLVVVNKRHVAKSAIATAMSLRWVSKYGSVTFNQFGREWPNGGMNEAGLVIELMWLEDTDYPAPDDRPELGCLQWIQYQLDNCATVEEVIATEGDVRIQRGDPGEVHYLVSDARGGVASIEFVAGMRVVHTGDAMPQPVLTNSTYASSLAYLGTYEGFGGTAPLPRTKSSEDRFVCAAALVRAFPAGADAIDFAFAALDSVAQGEYTQWSIVYDIASRRIHYRTHPSPSLRYIEFAALDFSCDEVAQVLDINAALSGEVSEHFTNYTYQANLDLVKRAARGTPFLKHLTRREIQVWAGYPGPSVCAE